MKRKPLRAVFMAVFVAGALPLASSAQADYESNYLQHISLTNAGSTTTIGYASVSVMIPSNGTGETVTIEFKQGVTVLASDSVLLAPGETFAWASTAYNDALDGSDAADPGDNWQGIVKIGCAGCQPYGEMLFPGDGCMGSFSTDWTSLGVVPVELLQFEVD